MHDWSPRLSSPQFESDLMQLRSISHKDIVNINWQHDTDGANRDPVSTDYSQLSHVALRLMAETQAEGNVKYGYGNWQKGLPISNLASHALAHIFALLNGDVSENHLGHALWNLEKMAHFIETRPDLIDIAPLRKALEEKRAAEKK